MDSEKAQIVLAPEQNVAEITIREGKAAAK